jgi:hypothetical protein
LAQTRDYFAADLDFHAAMTTSAIAVRNPTVVSVKLIPANSGKWGSTEIDAASTDLGVRPLFRNPNGLKKAP